MNTLSTNVSVTSVVDSARNTVSTNQNTQTSSSNYFAGNAVVTGSAWTTITLGTLTDVIGLTVYNDTTTYSASVVQISASVAGNSGLLPIGAILIPGSQAVFPWSGSLVTIAAKVIGSYPPFSSGSFSQAGLANIQIIAQQS